MSQKHVREFREKLETYVAQFGAKIIAIELAGNGHHRITLECGQRRAKISYGNSPSDHRTLKNTFRDAKRAILGY
jgi:hypothetical protein